MRDWRTWGDVIAAILGVLSIVAFFIYEVCG
jgi:hypothetical protein